MEYNRVGVHIRMRSSLKELELRADSLDLPFFQCFLVPQELGKLIQISPSEIYEFVRYRRALLDDLFCHVSYWVNLASLGNNGFGQLLREIAFAKRLEFTHFVLHAGTAKGAMDKMQGIEALARALNDLFLKEEHISLLLENSCHGNLAVGSDIQDFKLLLNKLDKPERIKFCIDTAHAYSYGYNIADLPDQEKFITLLDKAIGVERIQLIHLNDTKEKLGSRMDRHAIIGQGLIGIDALKHFAMHEKLTHIPLLLELPEMCVEDELVVLNEVRGW